MNIFKTSFKALAILTLLVGMQQPLSAKDHKCSSKSHKCSKVDPIVGVWNLTLHPDDTQPNFVAYGGWRLFADGSMIEEDTGSIGGPNEGPGPVLAGTGMGSWKRVSKNKYKAFWIQLVNAVGVPPAYFPTNLAGRLVVTADITLSKDGKTFSVSNGLASVYDYSDPTLMHPTVVAIDSAIGYKITFDTFE
jgi:hypothetical protein